MEVAKKSNVALDVNLFAMPKTVVNPAIYNPGDEILIAQFCLYKNYYCGSGYFRGGSDILSA